MNYPWEVDKIEMFCVKCHRAYANANDPGVVGFGKTELSDKENVGICFSCWQDMTPKHWLENY